MKKAELRKIYKQKRINLSSKEIKELEQGIYHQIFEQDYSSVKNIHIFLPIERQKEIDTYPIIDFFKKLNKKIIIPKCNFSDNTLVHFILDENTTLETNNWGIIEPKNAIEFDVKNIDLVFVPMLISDKKNYRVGYGKGFYDRFLAECKTEVKTIGLNFFRPIEGIDDLDKYDFALDIVIYPKERG